MGPKKIFARQAALLLVCLLLIAETSLSAEAASLAEGDLVSCDPADNLVPAWTGGALVAVGRNITASPVVHAFDAHGEQISVTPFAIPEANTIAVNGFSRAANGVIAICGSSFSLDRSMGDYLAIIYPQRNAVKLTHLNSYKPYRVPSLLMEHSGR